MGIYNDYFKYTQKWKKEYGEKTIVLMQVGAFFEVYALKDKDGKLISSNIEDFSQICDMIIAEKSKSIVNNKPVMMAGFNLTQYEKYVKKLQEHGYTIAVYTQDIQGKNTPRSLAEIISPGTFFCNDSEVLSNISMSIWINYVKPSKIIGETIVFGISTLDVYTGNTTLHEEKLNYHHNPCTYDCIERLITIYQPAECLIVSNLNKNILDEIINFIGLNNCKLHIIDKNNKESILTKYAVKSEKQVYQKEILKNFYPELSEETIVSAIQDTHPIAVQSFVLLLEFINEHSPNMAKKLNMPIFDNNTNRLILANHSLRQLNIINDNRHNGKLGSVGSLLNNCVTAMGKRNFNYDLHHPITDIDKLNLSYNTTEELLKNKNWETYREYLCGIHDLEKFKRKLILQKTTPKDIALLLDDLHKLNNLVEIINEEYVIQCINSEVEKNIKDLLINLENVFDKDKCVLICDMSREKLGSTSPDTLCFIKKGNSSKVDQLINDCLNSNYKLAAIANKFSEIIGTMEKSKKTTCFVKIHETAKSDPSLIGTKRRCSLFKNWIDKQSNQLVEIEFTNYRNQKETFNIDISNITFASNGSNKTNDIICSTEIKDICSKVQHSIDDVVVELISTYNKYLSEIFNKIEDFDTIIDFATKIDVIQSKAYTAYKYNYCKPNIITDVDKAFVNFTSIRHPLIEHIQSNELYVTNDLVLGMGNESDGILLYGTNAVGKTSFIKSIGIAIIMAQAGLYVPCKSFMYFPYNCLFTRILGNDNLFKGLSTFAVEMCELRTILTQCDKNSLILGDELCSGTESDSALSIFTTGLEFLHEKHSTFLFATHFHEVTHYEEVLNLERVKFMHMEVEYNREKDILIYDRKLKNGSGNTMYGLEVCKSLNLPTEFLARAHDIRMKYNKSTQGIFQQSGSHYNAKKIAGGNCEICSIERASDVHHLQHQVKANKNNNYINSFHKNHPANLINICSKCHNKIHQQDQQHRLVKTSDGYILRNI